MTQLYKADLFPFDQDEAVELTIHHLRLAAVFFMNTPDDAGKALVEELQRQRKRLEAAGEITNDDWYEPAMDFLQRAVQIHDARKNDD